MINKRVVFVCFSVLFIPWALTIRAQEGTLYWKYNLNDNVVGAPAIGIDSSIYISGVNFSFYAFHPDSTLCWSVVTSDFNRSPVVGFDGTIYVNRDLYLTAYNPNGTEKWSKLVYNNWSQNGISIALGPDGTIYMSGADTTLRAFDANGNQKWKINLLPTVNGLAVNRRYGTIYATSYSNTTACFYAINSDGTIAWQVYQPQVFSPRISLDHQGNIYVGNSNGKLYCFNPYGVIKWDYQAGNDVNGCVFGEDGTIYFGSDDSYLYALNPDGALKWRYQTGALIQSTPAIGNDGVIYFGSWDWYIYALNPDSTLRWRYQTNYVVGGSPAIGTDGTLYIGSDDNNLYAIHCSSTGLANSPWPRAGHDNQNTNLGGEPTSAPLFPDRELYP